MKEPINRESNRLGVIQAFTKGECPGAICEQYPMVSRSTVYRWIKAFVQKHQTGFKPHMYFPTKSTWHPKFSTPFKPVNRLLASITRKRR